MDTVCYIHYNPIKAGLEEYYDGAYRWSSFQAFLEGNDDLVDVDYTLGIFGGMEAFLEAHENYDERKSECQEFGRAQKRLPDDVAQEIVEEISGCKNVTAFQNLPIPERDKYICEIGKRGISIRQMNRVTGISRGKIERILGRRDGSPGPA